MKNSLALFIAICLVAFVSSKGMNSNKIKVQIPENGSVALILQDCFAEYYTPDDQSHQVYDIDVKSGCSHSDASDQIESLDDQLAYIGDRKLCAINSPYPQDLQNEYLFALDCAVTKVYQVHGLERYEDYALNQKRITKKVKSSVSKRLRK